MKSFVLNNSIKFQEIFKEFIFINYNFKLKISIYLFTKFIIEYAFFIKRKMFEFGFSLHKNAFLFSFVGKTIIFI